MSSICKIPEGEVLGKLVSVAVFFSIEKQQVSLVVVRLERKVGIGRKSRSCNKPCAPKVSVKGNMTNRKAEIKNRLCPLIEKQVLKFKFKNKVGMFENI